MLSHCLCRAQVRMRHFFHFSLRLSPAVRPLRSERCAATSRLVILSMFSSFRQSAASVPDQPGGSDE